MTVLENAQLAENVRGVVIEALAMEAKIADMADISLPTERDPRRRKIVQTLERKSREYAERMDNLMSSGSEDFDAFLDASAKLMLTVEVLQKGRVNVAEFNKQFSSRGAYNPRGVYRAAKTIRGYCVGLIE